MNTISDFRHSEGSHFVGWVSSGIVIKKDFDCPVVAVPLRNACRVLVIEQKRQSDNATIYDADGTLVGRVRNPVSGALCFGDAYYVGGELTLVSRSSNASMTACVIDEDGHILRTYETR